MKMTGSRPSQEQRPSPDSEQVQRHTAQPRQPHLSSSDPYAVLGLSRRASQQEIKRAYFALVRQYSPETAPDAFKLIRAAYEKLNTEEAKAETDLFLFQPPLPWQPRKRRRKLETAFDPQDIALLLQDHGDLGKRGFTQDFRPVKL